MALRRGFTLVELMVSMGVVGSLAMVEMQEEDVSRTQDNARAMGVEIFQYNNAVSRFLATAAADPSSIGVSSGSSQTFTGSDWLKSTSCGGTADSEYLVCEALPNGQTVYMKSSPRTTVSMTSEGGLLARTVWMPAISSAGEEDSLAMGVAALVASGSYVSQADSGESGYQLPTVYCPDISAYAASISDICDTDRHRIVSMVNTNSAIEPWLRTDHGNTMRHVIEFSDSPSPVSDIDSVDDGDSVGGWSGSGMRQMINISRLYNKGGSGSDSIVIGSQHGKALFSNVFITSNALLQDAMIVDGDAAVMEDLRVRANAYVEGNITSGNDIRADRDISSARDIASGRDIRAVRNITSLVGNVRADNGELRGRSVRSLTSVRAESTVHGDSFVDNNNTSKVMNPSGRSEINAMTATGDIRSPRFYDQNNTGFYLDPASTSRLNSIDASYVKSRGEVRGTLFRDHNATSRYMNPSSRSVINSLTAVGDLRARIFYDQDHTGYYLNPASTSRLNVIDANTITARGRLKTNNYLHLNRTASEGGSCSPNGLLGRLSDGSLLNCVSRRWKKVGGGTSGGGGGGYDPAAECRSRGTGWMWNGYSCQFIGGG